MRPVRRQENRGRLRGLHERNVFRVLAEREIARAGLLEARAGSELYVVPLEDSAEPCG